MRVRDLLLVAATVSLGCSSTTGSGSGNAKTPPSTTGVDDIAAETWTWVDVPDSRCGNGAATGIGVNLTDRSDDLFVYFAGGGACWDVNTCFVLNAAVNIESGYDGDDFAQDATTTVPAFNRGVPNNPLRDMSWVYVPYCTGDLHAGNKATTYSALGQTREVHHVGGANTAHFIDVIQTLGAHQRVFVSGSSAGGYGAQLNAHRFIDAFPEVHVLSDSAPMIQPYGGRLGNWNSAWAIQTPAACDDCVSSLPAWFDHLTGSHTSSRFGLLAYDADQTLHLYFGYPLDNSFQTAMNDLITTNIATAPNAHAYVHAGTEHVMLHQLTTLQHPRGVALADWVASWISGTDWSDALPD